MENQQETMTMERETNPAQVSQAQTGQTNVTIILSIEETNALLNLIDIAVKSGGIRVGKAAVILTDKILEAANVNPENNGRQ